MDRLSKALESIYSKYNKREYVDPDPLLFLYDYAETRDREIAGFIAAAFAYGRVEMIMRTVESILTKLSPSPSEYLITRGKKDFESDFSDFKYRFASEKNLTSLFMGIKEVLNSFSSLENCFFEGQSPKDDTTLPGLTFLIKNIDNEQKTGHLLANPEKKSACKRSHLFLRWMIRKDIVDPGGWKRIKPSKLIIPLDTHMYKAGVLLGFTKRKSRDIKTAVEITKGFKKLFPDDPVKFDFCLTRFGIRNELSMDYLTERIKK